MMFAPTIRPLTIALILTASASGSFAQNGTANIDYNQALSQCANQAIAAGTNTLAALKSTCEEQYTALQNSLPEDVRTGTMSSLDRMLSALVAAKSSPSN